MDIHVIDPDVWAPRLLRRHLTAEGYTVSWFAGLEAGLFALRRQRPAAVVTELLAEPRVMARAFQTEAPGLPVLLWTQDEGLAIHQALALADWSWVPKTAPVERAVRTVVRLTSGAGPP